MQGKKRRQRLCPLEGTPYPLTGVSFVFRSDFVGNNWYQIYRFMNNMMRRLTEYASPRCGLPVLPTPVRLSGVPRMEHTAQCAWEEKGQVHCPLGLSMWLPCLGAWAPAGTPPALQDSPTLLGRKSGQSNLATHTWTRGAQGQRTGTANVQRGWRGGQDP